MEFVDQLLGMFKEMLVQVWSRGQVVLECQVIDNLVEKRDGYLSFQWGIGYACQEGNSTISQEFHDHGFQVASETMRGAVSTF